jgi:hypothetical protein
MDLKKLLFPAPQKFNTFTTFAIFANFNLAREYPILLNRQAPCAQSASACAVSTPHPPLLQAARRAGYPRSGWRVRG